MQPVASITKNELEVVPVRRSLALCAELEHSSTLALGTGPVWGVGGWHLDADVTLPGVGGM